MLNVYILLSYCNTYTMIIYNHIVLYNILMLNVLRLQLRSFCTNQVLSTIEMNLLPSSILEFFQPSLSKSSIIQAKKPLKEHRYKRAHIYITHEDMLPRTL